MSILKLILYFICIFINIFLLNIQEFTQNKEFITLIYFNFLFLSIGIINDLVQLHKNNGK
ncbi:hypothetical protein CMI47_12755 [Candidatus Pacearchaeota archaeon]|nr:hypothetical protein [Candidatus Pacearchaeota archaeon]